MTEEEIKIVQVRAEALGAELMGVRSPATMPLSESGEEGSAPSPPTSDDSGTSGLDVRL